MPPKTKKKGAGKGSGYNSTDKPPEAPEAKELTKADAKDGDSESEESSSDEDAGNAGAGPAEDIPKFKTKAELRAWEAELKKAALEDEKTINRLEEVKARREKARLEREAAEKAAAEDEAKRKAEAKAAEEARQKELSERPTLELPGPKDVKTACMKLQECASDAFLTKHGLKGATGNKLAKIKHGDFKKIFDDFQENADISELHKYKGT